MNAINKTGEAIDIRFADMASQISTKQPVATGLYVCGNISDHINCGKAVKADSTNLLLVLCVEFTSQYLQVQCPAYCVRKHVSSNSVQQQTQHVGTVAHHSLHHRWGKLQLLEAMMWERKHKDLTNCCWVTPRE